LHFATSKNLPEKIMSRALVRIEKVEQSIFQLRGQTVILDGDLARFYGVSTKRLNQQVRRNRRRFPPDFLFQLTAEEMENLRLQNATSKGGRGGRRYPPLAFTEHGALMVASVLNTPRAIEVSVMVVRAFVRVRGLDRLPHVVLSKLAEMEHQVGNHEEAIKSLVRAFQEIAEKHIESKRRRIGFGREKE
jgi:hypothetical protein